MAVKRYISDLHFGHQNIIKFDKRPFLDVNDMESGLIERWNSVVQKGDITYILGDFCWGAEEEWIRILKKLNGSKILVRGNHDLKHMSDTLRKMFAKISEYDEIADNGRHVVLSHYPIMFYKSSWNENVYHLCGHVHTTRENDFLEKWRAELKASRSEPGDSYAQIYNVGCMMPYMDYAPKTLDEIIESCGD